MEEKTVTLFGGSEITVSKSDGTSETVKVIQLPIKAFPKLQGILTDENAQVELYCGKEPGWAEGLTVQAHEAVITEGERVNKDFFLRWVERQKARLDLLPKRDMAEVGAVLEAVARANPALLQEVLSGPAARRPGEVRKGSGLPSGLPRSAPSAG